MEIIQTKRTKFITLQKYFMFGEVIIIHYLENDESNKIVNNTKKTKLNIPHKIKIKF
jgi:hypothetical protein